MCSGRRAPVYARLLHADVKRARMRGSAALLTAGAVGVHPAAITPPAVLAAAWPYESRPEA